MKTAEEIGSRILVTLTAQTERNKQVGILKRARISQVLAANAGSENWSAARICTLLGRSQKLRTVQKHLKILRAQSSVLRD
jgi:hypothetical protein